MKHTKLISILLAMLLALPMTGCSEDPAVSADTEPTAAGETQAETEAET